MSTANKTDHLVNGIADKMNGNVFQINGSVKNVKEAETTGNAKAAEAAIKENDPWKTLPGFEDTGPKWSELSGSQKVKRIVLVTLKITAALGLLYFFICSIDILGSAFQVLGGRSAGYLFTQNSLVSNPVAGLMIGVLATVLLQSSSTTTSIIVALVASNIVSVKIAIPMVMGCNIGTTVTNTIVSLGQVGEREQFRRAFAGATVHDVFNWTVVCILLPIEVWFGYLYHLSSWLVDNINLDADPSSIQGLSVITHPFTSLVIQVDKKVITAIAENDEDVLKRTIIKYWDKKVNALFNQSFPIGQVNQTFVEMKKAEMWTYDFREENITALGITNVYWMDTVRDNSTYARHMFWGCGTPEKGLGETGVGLILLILSLAILLISLIFLVKALSSLLQGTALKAVNRVLNAELPGYLSWLTGYIAMAIGILFTIVLQSSSVFTSILTPLVGIGVLTVERMYPLTLGSNIGTTATSLIAAFAGDNVLHALQIAFCHLFFNITGVILFYPVPFLRAWPPFLAMKMGNTTADHRWFAFAYIVVMFLIVPIVAMGLSVGGWQVLYSIGAPIIIFLLVIIFTNLLQDSAPSLLPEYLRDWNFLPVYLRSLEPYDKIFAKCSKKKNDNCDDAENSSQASSASEIKKIDSLVEEEKISAKFSSDDLSMKNGNVNNAFNDDESKEKENS